MENINEETFGGQCADFVEKEISYLDCSDFQDRDFALNKLNARVGAIEQVRKTENDEVRERGTSNKDLKLQDHVPHDKSKKTWYRLYWTKGIKR